MNSVMMWSVFNVVIAVMLYIDLALGQKKAHAISIREAAIWSAAWVGVSLGFCWWVAATMGQQKALEFLTGYVIEKSLSVDNLFVFIMIFSYFHVAPLHQPHVLKWGIIGALVMRLVLILIGVTLLEMFHWIIYLFGGILIYSGWRMAFGPERALDPEKNPVVRWFRRLMPTSTDPDHHGHFFVLVKGVRHATPLFIALLIVEVSDLVFAVDSIPAVLAISHDPFIVYTSNAFAILGLRALYFLLSGIVGLFRYLKFGVSIVLVYVGIKMLIVDFYKIPVGVSLGVVVGILTLSIIVSLLPSKGGKSSAKH